MNLFSHRPQRTPAPAALQPAVADRPVDHTSPCGWFASSAELRRGLSVTELEIAPADLADAWRRWAAVEAIASRNPACRTGARG